jgi:hypothetical protein
VPSGHEKVVHQNDVLNVIIDESVFAIQVLEFGGKVGKKSLHPQGQEEIVFGFFFPIERAVGVEKPAVLKG